MSSRRVARLPPELCADTVAIAAWEASEIDKPWLSLLATTSQLVLYVVKPILYHTVLLTDSNFERVLSTAHTTGNFSLTRRVWISTAYAALKPAPVAHAFARVEHFSGWHNLYFRLRAQNDMFCPRMLTLRSNLYRADWYNVRAMRHITHLHLAIEPYYLLPTDLGALGDSMVLRYVILEATTAGWNPSRLINGILPFFLSSARLERLLVCATTHQGYMKSTYVALEEFVVQRRERRLWILDVPTDGKRLPTFRPGVTFDEDKWTAGRQLYASLH